VSLAGLLATVAAAFLADSVGPALAQSRDSARDAWQRPAEVMDLLGVHEGSRVADVGCGRGYFVLHLARRVGEGGRVFGVDIDEDSLERVRKKVSDAGLTNVEIVHSRTDDTLLPPASVDVVMTVNAYHEMREYDAMLGSMFAALKPGGLLAIIDAAGDDDASRSSLRRSHRSSEAMVKEDAARNGFRFWAKEKGFQNPGSRRREWFFLIFEKPAS